LLGLLGVPVEELLCSAVKAAHVVLGVENDYRLRQRIEGCAEKEFRFADRVIHDLLCALPRKPKKLR
jgi:hypothetical protein